MEKKKSVGIITMHRVLNCGSAIQAYALQRVIQNYGFYAEIIDYMFPNKYHKRLHKVVTLHGFFKEIYGFVLSIKAKINFRRFYKKFYNLSKHQYNSKEDLLSYSPNYDFYLSGSDQVWNPKSIAYDTETNEQGDKIGHIKEEKPNIDTSHMFHIEMLRTIQTGRLAPEGFEARVHTCSCR